MNLFEKKLLAVETAGEEIRAAVVRRRGKAFEIVDFAAMRRPDPEDDLPSVEAVGALAERMQRIGGPAVFVTPMARAFDLLMDREKSAGLKSYQLAEAVKWEVEPYTGIAGTNALVGVEPARRPESLPGEVVFEDERDDQLTFNVSAMERNVYRAIRERFRAAGFSLVRVYPPDVTFYMPLLIDAVKTPRAILEVGRDYSNFAIVRGQVPEQISTLGLSLDGIAAHLSGEMVSGELLDSLRFTIRQAPGPEPLVISGPGAADPAVVDFIAGVCPNGARVLELSRAAGITDARADPGHAAYGSAVGAAVRELSGRRERRMGIDDAVPLALRLKNSAYIAPLATAVILVALLLGHYGYMKRQDRAYNRRIRQLSARIEVRKAEVAKYDALIRESDRLKADISFAEKRLAFMTGRADKDLERVVACLGGMATAVTDRLVLAAIFQESQGIYIVTGTARNLGAVGDYATALQAIDWCEAVVMKKVARGGGGGIDFELTVTTRGGGA